MDCTIPFGPIGFFRVPTTLFRPVFHPGRKDAVRIANDRPGQRILQVGAHRSVAPSFSPGFAVKTDRRLGRNAGGKRDAGRAPPAHHVEGLHEMMPRTSNSPTASFDSVLALYVASVVPNPARFAAEMRRVCNRAGHRRRQPFHPAEPALALDRKAAGRLARHNRSMRFSVRCVPEATADSDPRGTAEQISRLYELLRLRQRKAGLQIRRECNPQDVRDLP